MKFLEKRLMSIVGILMTGIGLNPDGLVQPSCHLLGSSPEHISQLHISQLIEKLGSQNFQIREASTKSLHDIGEPALEKLRFEAKNSVDLEIRHRASLLVKIIEKEVYRLVQVFTGHSDEVCSVAFSPDGTQVLSGSVDGTMMLWDRETGEEIRRFIVNYLVTIVAFSPSGNEVLSGDAHGLIRVWNKETGEEICCLIGNSDFVNCVVFSPDGSHVFCGGSGKSKQGEYSIPKLELKTGKVLTLLRGHESPVYGIAISADGQVAISGGGGAKIILWDLIAGKELRSFDSPISVITCVAITADGNRALTGDFDGKIHLWDCKTGKRLLSLEGHSHQLHGVAFSYDNRFAISCSGDVKYGFLARTPIDWSLRYWSLESGKELHSFVGHREGTTCTVFSPDSRFVLSGGADNRLMLWRVPR